MTALPTSLQRCDMISWYRNRQCAKMHGLGYSVHLVCSTVTKGRREYWPNPPS